MSAAYSIANAIQYIRRPYFPAGRDPLGEAALRHLTQLLGLSLGLIILLSGLIGAVVTNLLGDMPENVNAMMGQTNPLMLLLLGVVVAPIIEELIFRSWLGGRKACLIGLPVLTALAAVSVAATRGLSPMVTFALGAGFGFMIFAIASQYERLTPSGQKQARWRLFPTAFYGSAMLFALLHLSNYSAETVSPIFVVLVLPQAFIGLVLGYVRMRFGLMPAIWFHAFYNLVLLGLFLVSTSLSPIAETTAIMSLSPALAATVFGA
jgi:membrane protease YdiL (CAAX protease family)